MNNNKPTSNLLELIPPSFYEVFLSDKENNLLSGGRSSFKSTVVSTKLGLISADEPLANIVVFRKVGNTLRNSVYSQIKMALNRLGISHFYKFRTSPMTILRRDTNCGFYFFGVDDPVKIKSAIFSDGYVRSLWFEEFAEFASFEEIDIIQDTFIRESTPNVTIQTFMTYNPPRNPYDWVNDFRTDKVSDPTYLLHHSTYKDDTLGFLSDQILSKIERYASTDPDYYAWQYLGEVIGLGDIIYNIDNFLPLDELPVNDQVYKLYFSMDAGHINSATTVSCYGLTRLGNVILLDTYYYSPSGKVDKKAPSELSTDINAFERLCTEQYPYPVANRTIDSAEGGLRNQLYKDFGEIWHPVPKKRKSIMIDFTYDLLAQQRLYYLTKSTNDIFIEQHKKYQWKTDTIETSNPQVVEVDDHTCDAFQYFVTDNIRDLNLKF